MSAPLSGIGSQPQAPLSSPFQSARSERGNPETHQPSATPVSEVTKAAGHRRGSLVDILV